MAGRPDATEKATPKRRQEARERGQVAKSPDLTGAAIFLIAVIILHLTLLRAVDALGVALQSSLGHLPGAASGDFTVSTASLLVAHAAAGLGLLMAALFAAVAAVAVLGNVLQFGLVFSAKPLVPSFAKLNPLTGLQRMVSKDVAVNLLKQLLKLGAVFVLVYLSIHDNLAGMSALAGVSPRELLTFIDKLLFTLGVRFGVLLLLIGAADYAYQRRRIESALMMTKQEVKDEQRQNENPEAKAAVRKRQREMARRRMMAAVPKATAVITNPTHFAVALQWDELKMDAPVLTATGADLIAKRIRELAQEHGVPIMENPPLARALYYDVELDTAVPPAMYAAVAQVIAFVFRSQNRTIA
jgi:flagellar biosynthetic protein FlhB